MIRERTVRFGKSAPLNAVITEPSQIDENKPALIILNSGIMHKVGACRLSVKIARTAAEAGILCLRFDHAGIGDSEPRRGTAPFERTAPEEVIDAMNYLSDLKRVKRFVLYGLCSGADMSFETAKIDVRVMGVIQIDAYAYRTPKYYLHYYLPRMMQWGVWINFIINRIPVILGLKKKQTDSSSIGEENMEMPSYIRDFPPQSYVEEGVQALVNRSVHLYYIFTAGQQECMNYQGQFRDMFPSVDFKNLLKETYLSDSSHIIKEPHNQKRVAEDIRDWILQRQ
jgi:hypothetical protein